MSWSTLTPNEKAERLLIFIFTVFCIFSEVADIELIVFVYFCAIFIQHKFTQSRIQIDALRKVILEQKEQPPKD